MKNNYDTMQIIKEKRKLQIKRSDNCYFFLFFSRQLNWFFFDNLIIQLDSFGNKISLNL